MKLRLNRALGSAAIIVTLFAVLAIANILPPTDIAVLAKNNVSGSDAVSVTDVQLPPVNRINVFENPLKPMATGMLTHVTSSGASISVADLFNELGIAGSGHRKGSQLQYALL